MAIRPRGSTWQVDLTVAGRRLPRYAFPTRKEAETYEAEARAAALAGRPIPCPKGPASGTDAKAARSRSGNGSVNTLADCLAKTHARFWAGTASDAKGLVNMAQIEAYFGADVPITDIDTASVDGFIDHCIAKANANGTINRKLAVLSKTLRYALDRGLIDRMPRLERKKEGKGRIRWLNADEEAALLGLLASWGKDDHVDVVTILIDTGMRPNEVYKMIPRDVDLKAGSITIWENKTDHPRTIFMTKRVSAIVARRIGAATAPGELLFPFDNPWMRHAWDRARHNLGFAADEHFVPYICRHTCASRLVQRGVPINVVKEWMGHKSITMTMRYAHLAPSNLKAAAGVLEDA